MKPIDPPLRRSEQRVYGLLTMSVGDQVRVSTSTLMLETGMARSTVRAALDSLQTRGLIAQCGGGIGRGNVAVYTLIKGPIKRAEKGPISVVKRADKRADTAPALNAFQEEPNPPLGSPPPAESTFTFSQLLGTQTQLPVTQTVTAQTILAELVDEARAANVDVPRRVVGQFARPIKELLDEGMSPEKVRAGIAAMIRKGKVVPSLLANFTMEAQLPTLAPAVNGSATRFGRGYTAAQIRQGGTA